jgi:PPOX class probable F420-dependent enzyme
MIADAYHDLLHAPNTAVLASLLPDGTPQASPVWFWFDGERIMVSTTAERQKHRNVKRSPDVALTVVDPDQPLRYLEIRGRVELADDPEFVIRDAIARKHGFPDGGAFDEPGSHRVTMTIVPTRVIEH